MTYIMKRYPANFFQGIYNNHTTSRTFNEEVFEEKRTSILKDFPGYERPINLILNRIKSVFKEKYPEADGSGHYYTLVEYDELIHDILISDNGKSIKAGIIPRLATGIPIHPYYTDKSSYTNGMCYDQYFIVRTEKGATQDQDKYAVDSPLGYVKNTALDTFNSNKMMYLRPAKSYEYGVFEGIYDFPYKAKKNYNQQSGMSGIPFFEPNFSGAERFYINGKKYMIGFNNGMWDTSSSWKCIATCIYRVDI